MICNRPAQRSGVTLLLVMSMIVLFLLMGTTFMIVTNNFLKSARQKSKLRLKGDDPQVFVEQALYDIIRGPDLGNTMSPLRGHSLLADMYGYGFTGTVFGVPRTDSLILSGNQQPGFDTQGQFVEFELENLLSIRDPINGSTKLSDRPGFYNGFVISFVAAAPLSVQQAWPAGLKTELNNQPAVLEQAISGRIVRYQPADQTNPRAKFLVMLEQPQQVLKAGTGPFPYDGNALVELTNARVVVNSRAFSGRGAGSLSNATNGAALSEQALIPNRLGESRAGLITNYLADDNSPNESYDAADFQNMFLFGRDTNGDPIPSFYRRTLETWGANNNFVKLPADGWNMVDNDNDGEGDSYWMDIGLPIQSDGSGRLFKPMVAYRVEDMGGRLNLNFHGSLAETQNINRLALVDSGPASSRGQGYGPAEISLSGLFPNAGGYKSLLENRYGPDNQPGVAGPDVDALYQLFGYARGRADATQRGTVGISGNESGSFGSSAQDLRGQYVVGLPQTSGWPDPNFPGNNGFNNALPGVDVTSTSGWNDELVDHPYEVFPYWARHGTTNVSKELEPFYTDTPFSLPELEKLLRQNDFDNSLLPDRLSNLAANVDKNLITTDSFEVPQVPFGLPETLMAKMRPNFQNLTDAQLVKKIRDEKLLPDELFFGLKVNVNRAFGNGRDDNNNGVVDEAYYKVGGQNIGGPPEPLGELAQRNVDVPNSPWMDLDNGGDGGTGDELARYHFAKQLYIMALLLVERPQAIDTNAFRKQIAQWAVNVVDFRDSDSIMTPFEYDTNPWDGWDVDGFIQQDPNMESPPNTPPGTPAKDRGVVFGCERPELLLTESIALHDRRTEDESKGDRYQVDPMDNPPDPQDDDLDSRLVPNTAAFIEVYNPWTQNRLNQVIPPSLSDNPNSPKQATGINLARTSRGGDPVWRIQIKGVADPDWERAIYFTDAAPSNVTDIAHKYFTSCDVQPLAPGAHAVIGSANQDIGNNPESVYRTTFGRLSSVGQANEAVAGDLALETTRHIVLDSDKQQVRTYDPVTQQTTTMSAVAIPINRSWRNPNQANNDPNPQSLSVSDPDGGYPLVDASGVPRVAIDDGFRYADPYDTPRDDGAEQAVWTNGLTDNFRVLHLQRLANPLEPWQEHQNPYISIDCTPMDLLAFNGVQQDPNNDNQPGTFMADIDPDVVGVTGTAFDTLERGESQSQPRLLFKSDDGETGETQPSLANADGHCFSFEFKGSLGATNESYRNNGGNLGYAWLTWNNRPFVSHLELANVPISAPDKITYNFGLRNINGSPYTRDVVEEPLTGDVDLSGEFRHLLNLFGSDDDGAHFYRLFDYLEVPSRFIGGQVNLNLGVFNNHPFNFVPRYRVPGKINLNTIYREEVWNGLMGNYVNGQGVSWNDFQNSRKGSVAVTTASGQVNFEFAGVYRNSNEADYVPIITGSSADKLVRHGCDTGLFRRNLGNSQGPTLPGLPDPPPFVDSDVPFYDWPEQQNQNHISHRNAYSTYDMRQRLGNLVTTRSSVFAIWITVGLFEVNNQGQVTPNELGADTGDVRRHRGFFVLDRSIPVAFEPGKNHNVERAIRVSSFLE